jgi:hypothetical protein
VLSISVNSNIAVSGKTRTLDGSTGGITDYVDVVAGAENSWTTDDGDVAEENIGCWNYLYNHKTLKLDEMHPPV